MPSEMEIIGDIMYNYVTTNIYYRTRVFMVLVLSHLIFSICMPVMIIR